MKKKLFRKDSPLTRVTAAALSVVLAFGMTPAIALAQPADEAADSAIVALDATTLQNGTYSLTLTSSTGMITPATGDNAPKLVVNGSQSYLIFSECYKDAQGYPKYDTAWLGLRSEVETADASTYVKGIAIYDAEEAVDGFTYVLPIATSAVEAALNDESAIDAYICVRYSDRYTNSKGETTSAGKWMGSKDNYFTFSNVTRVSESTDLPQAEEGTTVTEIPAASITNNTGMFKVVNAQIETANGQSKLRFTLSGTGVKELFLGTFEECLANGDGTAVQGNNTWIHAESAVTLAEGKTEFVIPLTQGVSYIPVTSISNSHYTAYANGTEQLSQCMYPRYIEIDATALTLTAGDYAATIELAATVTGKAPAVTAASLNTVGGPNSNNYAETLTVATDAQAAYLGTAEAAATATEGIAEASEGSISLRLTGSNYGGGVVFDGKAAVAFKLSDGTWVDTAITVDKAAKTLAIVGEGPQPVTAEVTYIAQAAGAYLAAPATAEVASNLAESYGYADSIAIEEGVSAADVLVAANLAIMGEVSTDIVNWSETGYVGTLFGVVTTANGFMVNKGLPNDGTIGEYGYNGTTITTTKVVTGDVVDFFIYQDQSYYMDAITYVDVDGMAFAGQPFQVTASAAMIMFEGFNCIDGAALKAAAQAGEGLIIGVMDPETGAVTSLNAVSDEDGKATITFAQPGDYYLVAYTEYDPEDFESIPAVMNATKVTVAGDGTYNVTANICKTSDHSVYTMCKVGDAAVIINNGALTLRVRINTTNYKGIYLGPVASATVAETVMGTLTPDGAGYQIDLPITADMLGTTVDVAILKKDGKTFYTSKSYALELAIGEMSAMEGASPAAQAVIDAIDKLPEAAAVSYDDAANIRAARAAYNTLMEFRRAEVSNYDKLTAVETAYNQLPIIWPELASGYTKLGINDFAEDPYYMVAYNDNHTNIFVQIYVDARNYNRLLAMPASEVTADVTGGTLTAIADSDAGRVNLTTKEVQLGKTYTYTLAKIENGEVKATREISFTLPAFRSNSSEAAFAEGTYDMAVESTAAALNGAAAVLTSDGTAMTATVTPTAAVAKVYLGTAEAAAAATEGIIEADAQGNLVIPVKTTAIPQAIAVFDGTTWTDQRFQVVATAEVQAVISAIQAIYADGVDASGKALTRSSYWDIYPADEPAVNAAVAAYNALTEAQQAVVKQSNWSEMAHAEAMFASANKVAALIDALPETAEGATAEQVAAIKAAQASYDTCGDDIFTWYEKGSTGASIQDAYVQKLIPSEKKEKLAALYAAVKDLYTFATVASSTEVKPGETVTVDIVATAAGSLGAAEMTLNYDSSLLKLTSIVAGKDLNLGEGEAAGGFEATLSTGKISFFGNTAAAAEGIVVATATFETSVEGTATVSLSDVVCGATAATSDIENAAVSAPLDIVIAYAGDFVVSSDPYTATGIKLVTFVGEVAEGMTPTIKDIEMVKLGDDYVALFTAADAAALTRADLGMVEGAAEVAVVDGDASMNGKVNIVDSQVAYDLAIGTYDNFETMSMMGMLKADVNGDKFIDSADALAIQNYVHRGSFVK